MDCETCGHYDLEELGALGRRVHYKCRACGVEQSLVGFSRARLEDLSRQHGMDGGGYCWENAQLEPFAGFGCVAWDDPDFNYLTGETPAEARGRSAVFFWAPNKSVAWPASYAVQHGDTRWTYELVETGEFCARDVECSCHGKEAEGKWEYTGNSLDGAHPECPWCDGDGTFEGEGGAYATYVLDDS